MIRSFIGSVALALGALTAAPIFAATLAEQVQARLYNEPVLHGQFEQTQALKGFSKPLVSKGEFMLSRERGVVWNTQSPFPSTLIVTRERIVAINGKSAPQKIDATKEPGLKQVNDIVFALLSGDLKALGDKFEVTGDVPASGSAHGGWKLKLTPRDANLARFLGPVDLSGDRFVDTVHWRSGQGDETSIRFSKQSAATALTADEARRFD